MRLLCSPVRRLEDLVLGISAMWQWQCDVCDMLSESYKLAACMAFRGPSRVTASTRGSLYNARPKIET